MLDEGTAPAAFADALGPALARVAGPIETARGLPSALYIDDRALALERERLFHRGWSCVALEADAPSPGSVAPIDHLGAPLLLARGRDGALRLFENVCRHRGMILVEEKRIVEGALRCPYHSWCYDLEGRLRATPHVGGPGLNRTDALDPEQTGLTPVRMGVFLGLVFATFSADAPAFEDWIAPLAERWREIARAPLRHAPDSAFSLTVACNWKLAVENYCESYHLPWVHPGLNSYSRLEDHYPIVDPSGFMGQGTTVYAPQFETGAFPDFPDLSPFWDRAAEYAALAPNVLLGVHRDHVFAILLSPNGVGRTVERVEFFYATEEAATGGDARALRVENAALWRSVFEEDVFVVEGMQRGRAAPGFDGGRFSPAMDGPTHAFHVWAAERLL